MGNNKIENMSELCLALEYNTSLQYLCLSIGYLENNGIKELADSLKYNKSLRKLDFSKNSICPIGEQYIRDALEINIGIEEIIGVSNVDHLITPEHLAFKRNNAGKKSARK